MTAMITRYFALSPYQAEHYGDRSCVVNANGFNCLSFKDKPGAKFTSRERATAIAEDWNKEHALPYSTFAAIEYAP